MSHLLLADVGGTHVRLRLARATGEILQEYNEVGSGASEGSFTALLEELRSVFSRTDLGPFVGGPGGRVVLTGRAVPWSQGPSTHLVTTAALTGASSVTLVPDGIAGYVGCLGGSPGVVVTAGTGTIAIGVGYGGEVRRLDGWGPQLGDAGSGYRVGLEGLISACKCADGRRGGSRFLLEAAEQSFGRLEELPGALLCQNRVRDVARFSEQVVAAARSGDGTARQILDQAARELAELATEAAERITPSPELPVVIGGGFVAGVPELQERLRAWFAANSGRVPLVAPGPSALDGCYEIAVHGVPSPFAPWVSRLDSEHLSRPTEGRVG